MADEESSRDGSEDQSDRETYRDKVVQAANSSLEKLQFLAEDSLEYFHEQKNSLSTAVQKPQKCEPGPPPKTKTSLDDIKHRLLSLIAQEEEEEEETTIVYRRPGVLLDEVQKVSFVSHTMAAFVATLDDNLVRRIALQISSETTIWINRLFRFFDSSAYFHRNTKEGLVRIIRLVLHSRYPKYSSNGYEALYTRPPVIYYCHECRPGLQQHLCSELGLPRSCVVSVPVLAGAQSCSIDPTVLEKMVLEHTSAAKTPLVVIACAGTPVLGNMDDLETLQEFCCSHNMWLHVDGHSLAALSLVSTSNVPATVGHSMTLWLGTWIGVPTLPSVTLYRSQETAHVHASGLSQIPDSQLDALPIWITVQALGCDNIIRRIQHCFKLTDYLISKLTIHPELRVHTKELLKAAKAAEAVDDNVKNIGTMGLFNSLATYVIFQYVPQPSITDKESSSQTNMKNPAYFDNLNSWLVQLLSRNIPSVKSDILDLENFGICLRICFLESAHVMHTEKNDIDCYYNCLQHQLGILNATVKQRELLYKNHKNHRKLKLVQIIEWAGMGGARYIPEVWADRLNELTDTGKEDINNLNSELVAKLKVSDSAFSVGEADDGMLCVRFGMVDEELNMDELINLVITAGQEIEDSSRFLETMAEMVKHGIEEANKELVLENQEKLMQEGILKQVPVLGSLVSWWFPGQTEPGVKGRSFNLSSGTIESTENIYKYHMQIKEGGPQTPPPASKVLISPSASSLPTPPSSPPQEQTTADSQPS